MTWNYRIVRREAGDLVIKEVYYEGDTIVSWTEEPAYPAGESLSDLFEDHTMMTKAFLLPIVGPDGKEESR